MYEQEFIVVKGKHKCKPRPIRLWCNKKKFTFYFTIKKGWYRKDEIKHSGVSKLGGVAYGIHAEKPFGKIPIIKNLVNSTIVGSRPDFTRHNRFNIYLINDNRGVETRPLIYNVAMHEEFKVTFFREKGRVRVVINDRIHNIYPMNPLPFGYYLHTYFGGKSPAVRDFIVKLKRLVK